MKKCRKCGDTKPLSEFHVNQGRPRSRCKKCHTADVVVAVANWRRAKKIELVALFGGKCVDCGYVGPPFTYDFDHRDPTEKLFGVGEAGCTRSWAKMLAEAEKCDLVCANCHRMRTHKQRCTGCEHCYSGVV